MDVFYKRILQKILRNTTKDLIVPLCQCSSGSSVLQLCGDTENEVRVNHKHSHPAQSVLLICCSEQPSSRLLQWRLSHADLERVRLCVRIHACIWEQKSSKQCRKRQSCRYRSYRALSKLRWNSYMLIWYQWERGKVNLEAKGQLQPFAWWNQNSSRPLAYSYTFGSRFHPYIQERHSKVSLVSPFLAVMGHL